MLSICYHAFRLLNMQTWAISRDGTHPGRSKLTHRSTPHPHPHPRTWPHSSSSPQADGYTNLLNTQGFQVYAGQSYNFKLAIADAGDQVRSAVR